MLTRIKHRFRRVSDTMPEDFKIERISVADFAAATEDFVFENFRGAMTVEKPPLNSGYISISPAGFAYLLKLILNEVFGAGMVRAKILTSHERVEIVIELPEAKIDIESILNTAIRSGFCIDKSNRGVFVIYAKPSVDKDLAVYAIDFTNFKRYLNQIFFL